MADPADSYVIQTVKLTKVFRDFWHRAKVRAVDQLDLTVRRGEVFGLLGPNGSGKSTVVKLLLGLLFPTSGGIRVLGRPPRDVAAKARIGFLPEETYLYPYLNARETLDFFGRLSRLSRRERRRRVDALIEMVGLAPARNRPLREYSKGMARRIGLAQALISDPELLLLDEPTTGLDPIGAREVKDLILELKSRGKSILLSSHLLAHVEDVCDRIGILYGGRLCVVGEVSELLAKQQLTQITVPNLRPADLEHVKSQIQQVAGDAAIEVGHPLDRLESYFLRIIREAREAQPETSGAAAGHFDASLFRKLERPSSEQVLDRLTRPAPEPEPEEEAGEPPTPEPAPAPDVLQRLTAIEPAGEAEPEEKPQPPEAKPVEAEGRGVLDRLVHNPAAAKPEQHGQNRGHQ